METKEISPRWDFADLIFGGLVNGFPQIVVKHQHQASDITKCRDMLKEIYMGCVQRAFDGQFIDAPDGPAGTIVQPDFAFEYLDPCLEQLVRFRVHAATSVRGVHFFMRRINGKIPSLEAQGYPSEVIKKLLDRNRRGLVLFGGEMGAGKTSAASSMIRAWLSEHGGSAVTLEDPPEYALHGFHKGKMTGYCTQRQCKRDEMAAEIPGLMRMCAPEIIFLGEIRSPEVAREAVLAAANGHLIVSTIHGKGIEGVINRILSLSATPSMTVENVAKMLSESLSLVVYQDLRRQVTSQGGFEKVLSVSNMDIMDEAKRTAFASAIRNNRIEQLKQQFGSPSRLKSTL